MCLDISLAAHHWFNSAAASHSSSQVNVSLMSFRTSSLSNFSTHIIIVASFHESTMLDMVEGGEIPSASFTNKLSLCVVTVFDGEDEEFPDRRVFQGRWGASVTAGCSVLYLSLI